tara:strand:- start:27 stop:359 length:333 start_codon:yes stop_codon:yes gene_type:complete
MRKEILKIKSSINVRKDNTSLKLEKINERIEKARQTNNETSVKNHTHKDINVAWRMVLELVIGMVIGIVLGYSLDSFFSTKPLLIIIFSLLGFGAGVRTMMRTAKELNNN